MASKSKSREPLWLGGVASSMAACFTHPLDQTKYRMQVQSSRQRMLRALYIFATRDVSPSGKASLPPSCANLHTQPPRFGIYNYLAHHYQRKSGTKRLSASSTVACAGIAEGLAGILGSPTEIVLVRMCADGAKVPAQRFAYANAMNGIVRVAREEGFRAFFKGLGPNVVRSVLMNVSQIAIYTTTKSHLLAHPLLNLKDNIPTHIISSLAAGTVATTVCAPADVLKSRLQSATTAMNGKPQRLSQTIRSALQKEGPGFLMKGWTPAWLRLAPNMILMFIFMEQLQRLFA